VVGNGSSSESSSASVVTIGRVVVIIGRVVVTIGLAIGRVVVITGLAVGRGAGTDLVLTPPFTPPFDLDGVLVG